MCKLYNQHIYLAIIGHIISYHHFIYIEAHVPVILYDVMKVVLLLFSAVQFRGEGCFALSTHLEGYLPRKYCEQIAYKSL